MVRGTASIVVTPDQALAELLKAAIEREDSASGVLFAPRLSIGVQRRMTLNTR